MKHSLSLPYRREFGCRHLPSCKTPVKIWMNDSLPNSFKHRVGLYAYHSPIRLPPSAQHYMDWDSSTVIVPYHYTWLILYVSILVLIRSTSVVILRVHALQTMPNGKRSPTYILWRLSSGSSDHLLLSDSDAWSLALSRFLINEF